MQQFEHHYTELVWSTLHQPRRRGRNGYTRSAFGRQLNVFIGPKYFPLIQGRKMYYQGVLGELAAFMRGPKHIKDFQKMGCNYWNDWADSETGKINIDYGNKWLDFNGVNQLERLVNGLKFDPYGRRHIITGWDPSSTPDLPCCHLLYQFYVTTTGELDMIWYQRSVDLMVGLPADIILGAAWLIAVAKAVGKTPGTVKMMLGDCHIYEEHEENAYLYCSRVMKDPDLGKTTYAYNPPYEAINDITKLLPHDFKISEYNHLEPIKFDLIV